MITKLEPEIYEGAHLASMFAYPAVSSGSCSTKLGQKQASKYLVQYILSFVSGKPEERYEEALEVLEPLETLSPYLRAIAQEMKLDPLHKDVVEAYVLGIWPENLNTSSVFVELLNEFSKTDKVTPVYLRFLSQNAPRPFLPFHNYETLLRGLFWPNEKKINGATNCMVREGVVLTANKNKATVITKCLEFNHKEGKYEFQNCKSEVFFEMSFLEYIVIEAKMRVAIHQGHIIRVVDEDTFNTLTDRNMQTLKLFEKFGL